MRSFNKHVSKFMAAAILAGSLTIYGADTEVKADQVNPGVAIERTSANKSGFIKEGNDTFYYKSGSKTKGWVDANGERYYFLNDYTMAASMFRTINNVKYYFKADGTLAKNEIAKTSEGMFRFNADGSIVKGESYAEVGECDHLNIREEAGSKAKILGSVYTKDVVKVLEESNGWNKIETKDGLTGWVNASYLNSYDVNAKVEKVIAVAKAQMGKPYRWGATGPSSFDCSGLMLYSYQKGANVKLPRVSRDQAKAGVKVSKADLKPGDLVFFGRGGGITHVGMYLGNDQYIHAPQTGDVVKISKLSARTMVTARRIIK